MEEKAASVKLRAAINTIETFSVQFVSVLLNSDILDFDVDSADEGRISIGYS